MNLGDRHISVIAKIHGKYFIGLSLAAILPLPLSLLAQAQTVNLRDSVTQLAPEQSIIYVDPQTGDDAEGNGSRQLPLKTITQALKLAQPNTTIDLASGTYSEATGETFPIVVRENVSLEGTAGGKGHNVIIRGNGYFISPTGAGQNVTIAAIEDAAGIIGVTVTNPNNRGHGLWIESASPIVSSNTFSGNGNTGVSVNGDSSPLIENNLFYNNAGNGLLVYGTSQPQVNSNIFEKTGFGVSVVQSAAPTLTDNNFTGNRIGIILEGNSQAILRNNQIENSLETGLTAISQARVNLGTIDRPGNNIFRGNRKLDIQNASSNSIPAVGTEINGNTAGNIDFRGDSNPSIAKTSDNLPLPSDRPPLKLRTQPLPVSRSLPTTTRPPQAVEDSSDKLSSPPTLPSPPPLASADSEERELVFNAPEPTSQQVPFPPQPNTPSPLNSNHTEINSLSDVLGSSNATDVRYKVLVETTNNSQQTTVRSLYPEAFATVYQGKSMLQVGAFSNKSKAENASRSLQNLGLNTYILE